MIMHGIIDFNHRSNQKDSIMMIQHSHWIDAVEEYTLKKRLQTYN